MLTFHAVGDWNRDQVFLSRVPCTRSIVPEVERIIDETWRRIASHTEPAFDWHRDYAAIEFWHYQKTDGLSWWQSIQEIYPPKDLGDMFSYQNLVRAHYDISTLIQKGVPVPTDVMLRYSAMQP